MSPKIINFLDGHLGWHSGRHFIFTFCATFWATFYLTFFATIQTACEEREEMGFIESWPWVARESETFLSVFHSGFIGMIKRMKNASWFFIFIAKEDFGFGKRLKREKREREWVSEWVSEWERERERGTRPDTRLPWSHAGGQVQWWNWPTRWLGRSSNPQTACKRQKKLSVTNGRTGRWTKRVVESRARD